MLHLMKFNVISSGSKGNCTLIINGDKVIVLDLGVSKKRIEEALKGYGLSFNNIEAYFITHTHHDHASNCYQADINKLYATTDTLDKVENKLPPTHIIKPFSTFYIDGFKISSFPLSHDDKVITVGFIIECDDEKLIYLTDTGFVPEKTMPLLQNPDYLLIESNHDPKMLWQSSRPEYLIRRIISDTGHLSNYDSGYYIANLIADNTKEVVLLHLSEECNTKDIALNTVKKVIVEQLGYLPDIIYKASSSDKETKGGS